MKQSLSMGLTLILTFLISVPATTVHAAGSQYEAGLGFEFASGTYGTGTKTDSVYLPLTLSAYPTDRIDVSLEIPFVYQSSSSVVAGEFRGMQAQTMASQSVVAAMNGNGMGGGSLTSASGSGISTAQYGLGDVKLSAGYVLYTEERYVPAIRPNFYVKFPTADKEKYLGTGAFDEGAAVELTKWFGDWMADGEAGYAFQGTSTVVAVKDYLYYYLGGGYQVTDNLRPMLFFKGSTPTVEGVGSLLEARLRIKYQLSTDTGIDGYLSKGIATASPDYGMGIAIAHSF